MGLQRNSRLQFMGASIVVASAAALSLSGCSAGANDIYTWGAGTKVSSWYPIAATLKTQLSELDIRLQTTGGVSNAALVGQ